MKRVMKQSGMLPRWLRFSLLGLLGAGAMAVIQAQTITYTVGQFNATAPGYFADLHWGTAVPTITWDGSQNAITMLATNVPGSGSSAWVIPWTITGDQVMLTHAFGATLNLNQYSAISFDIHFDASSATDGAGKFGALEVDWIPTSDGWPSTPNPGQASTTFPSGNTNWIHAALPVNVAGVAKLSAVSGIGFKMQQSRTGANLSGTTRFWIDNIILSGFITPPVSGPPQIVQLNTAQPWRRLEFRIANVPTNFNAFDPDSVSVEASFSLPSGGTMTVPAFWYGDYQRSQNNGAEQVLAASAPEWRLRFAPPQAGLYPMSVAIKTNGQLYASATTNANVTGSPPARYGFAGVAPGNQYFQTGDGQALRLNGLNVAWSSSAGTYDYDRWFAALQNAGGNFARVWMSPNCFGVEHTAGARTNYSLPTTWQLDYVFQLAEQKGIYVQLCLDYHGMFEVTPDVWGGNNYWPRHPYNTTNGGPCLNQNAFFTNTVAKTFYEKRLRYLSARYGYSPNLLAWEFFNEIDHEFRYLTASDVITWHSELAGWLHTNDPFRHLVTTSLSYASALPALWSVPQLDFLSWHTYFNGQSNPALVMANDARSYRQTYGRAVQIGEYGTDWHGWTEATTGDPYLRGLRQGIWGGALGGSVGTAMSWWWDSIDTANDYWLYSSLSSILKRTGWGQGSWTNITVPSGQPLTAIGQCGARESLIYLVTVGAIFPSGATNAALPVQNGQTLILTNWPGGLYHAEWYDPVTGALVGTSQATTTNGGLRLPLPGYSVDLAGLVYPPPMLKTLAASINGSFQFQLNSETGGQYMIEKSTNLSAWAPFLKVTNTTGQFLLSDPITASHTQSFYRATHSR